ncbi:MAG: hypothetical protein O7F17_07020 [Planctomycetota bacterium]|nr:hypothetical protein [Planctomycetota bacterium]
MGTIATGIGLISGIDTATLIDNLIALEARGKLGLQARLVSLQARKTALLDINSRLLNFKNIAWSFRLDSIFKSALASSSNSDILTAIASAKSIPGTFTFIVKQLVSTSQKLSAGFVDTDTAPLALTSLSFEFGRGTLSTDTDPENLNGGAGVARGKSIIIDSIGTTTIDLTDVISLNEVLDRINNSGANVTAAVEGDHLVVTENSAGSLDIANAIGYTTATDLGIVGSGVGGTLTGDDINTISGSTALRSLNDGNGVVIRNNVADLRITTREASPKTFNIDLGRINTPIDNDTLLADLNNGAGVTISDNDTNPEFKFIARDLTEYEVDLTGITTVGGLISRVNLETGGHIQISIHADGDKFTVTNTVGGSGNLKVLGAGTNNTQTAEDLGILNEAGVAADSFDGQLIPNSVQDARAVTL